MSTSTSSPEQLFRDCQKAVPGLRIEPVAERKKRLSTLRRWIHKHRSDIHAAVYADFRKPSMEADATEIFHVLNEIKVALRSLDRWAAPIKIDAPFFLAGTRSWIQYEPRGVCLIIAPWNYPFNLAAGPLVSALAAGNSVIIKPSEITPSVSALIKKMCDEIFDPSIVAVCEGGVDVSQALLSLPFDHIFFTGSPAVGKIVMKAAADHLASVTLELGGKSPAIISASAQLNDAAERLAMGKFMNNGQTCIAPDYILADEKIVQQFVEKVIKKTQSLFAPDGDFERSPDYARIVNDAHYSRIQELLLDAVTRGAKIQWQGKTDKAARFMHPVILTGVSPDSRIMNEEIFGPVLPIISYRNIEDALAIIHSKPKALALYLFTGEKKLQQKVLKETSSGTVCINDCGVQFLHHDLPFGGVNHSGIGISHGQFGFQTFSNEKPVLKQKNGITAVKAFYPPFTNRTKKLMDWFLRLF
ncbi:MAG TPA: aldehyde dehydrogenase family protein [Chryseosolibacter sp.]|nr:aldehyde dehydrogenase family protein [Chryseosolibacter sp.]